MGWSGIKDYGFGTRPKEVDAEYRKKGQEINRGKPRVWTDEKIAEFIDELLTLYKKILIDDKKIDEGNPRRLKSETIRDMNIMVNRLLQFKEKYYPPIQRNINVNLDMASDKVLERLKEYKTNQVFEIVNSEIKIENE